MTGAAQEPNGEARIATALRNGDPAAIEELWREHGDTVYAVAMRGVGDQAAAEDVRQQVFTELWERRASYDPKRGPVRAWVMTVARSRTIDHLRRKRQVPTEPESFDRMEAPQRFENAPEESVERIGMGELLKRIPNEEAGILRMRFYDGLSQTEIAERTGIPLGTVKMRMVQALDRLRDLMEAEGAAP